MTWATRFRLEQSFRGSLWVWPLIGGVLGVVGGSLSVLVDSNVSVPAYWQYSSSTATTVLATIVGATAALTGFVVTVSVLAVQMATSTFSARYMRLWYRSRMLQSVLAVFVATLTFSFALLRRVGTDYVPNIGVTVAGILLFMSIVLFMVFFDRFLHHLRPVAVAALVAEAGRHAFDETMRAVIAEDAPGALLETYRATGEPTAVIRTAQGGSIQAIDGRGLVRWARARGCLVVLPRVVGDFVPQGTKVIEVYGGEPLDAQTERKLAGMIALGVERTIDQDPAFAIRVMVDIANKALSPAVNDPTTAVQVIDYLTETLRRIGSADLQPARQPNDAQVGALMRVRRWPDFLALASTEIRRYGSTSIQVHRRLRAMLEELRDDVRPEYRAAVEDELARLDATLEAEFAGSPDLDRARSADRQGIGGPT